VTSHGSEFTKTTQTGGHAHTANVTCPPNVPDAIIPWEHDDQAALDDIVLLLRLFTQRDVFIPTPMPIGGEPFAITADPRCYPWGGILACSIPYESEKYDDPYKTIDISLSVHLPKIYERIQKSEWQQQYKNGYFLVLLNQAIQQRLLEAAFGQCWTIWEHLFACLTDAWMSNQANRSISAKEKIAFLLVHFGIRITLSASEKSRLKDLVAIRNRLVHYGQFPKGNSVRSDAIMFIRMTEYISAKALGLFPSNIFNTIERFEEFLRNDSNQAS